MEYYYYYYYYYTNICKAHIVSIRAESETPNQMFGDLD